MLLSDIFANESITELKVTSVTKMVHQYRANRNCKRCKDNHSNCRNDGTFLKINAPKRVLLVFSSVGFGTSRNRRSQTNSYQRQHGSSNAQLQWGCSGSLWYKAWDDLTGAVTSISAKDFQKGLLIPLEQLLLGKVAGLEITNGGGQQEESSRIRIRGGASLYASNDPLLVIDGIPVEVMEYPVRKPFEYHQQRYWIHICFKRCFCQLLCMVQEHLIVCWSSLLKGFKGKCGTILIQLSTSIVGKTVDVLLAKK